MQKYIVIKLRVLSVRYADKSINVQAANKQGATELDSRVKNLSSSLYMRNFYFNLLMFVINLIFLK